MLGGPLCDMPASVNEQFSNVKWMSRIQAFRFQDGSLQERVWVVFEGKSNTSTNEVPKAINGQSNITSGHDRITAVTTTLEEKTSAQRAALSSFVSLGHWSVHGSQNCRVVTATVMRHATPAVA